MGFTLPEKLEKRFDTLDQKQQTLLIEVIEAFLNREAREKPSQIPSWVGIGASGRRGLSSRVDELLFADHSQKRPVRQNREAALQEMHNNGDDQLLE